MVNAIFAGTFDPFTTEHEYIAKEAAKIFETLYIVVATNPDKIPMFSAEDRKTIIQLSLKDIKNIKVMISNNIVVDLAKDFKVEFLVRGLRYTTEYEYELRLATGNLLVGGIPTLGIFPRTLSISSSDVRLLIKHGNTFWKNYVHPSGVKFIETLIK